jgi:ABC-type branched-subunit amino acid transport system ATPase component
MSGDPERFGGTVAVDQVNFDVLSGSIVKFWGV